MSAFTSRRAASPESVVICHTAHFAARWLHPSMVIIATHGELDAANAQEFVTYSQRHADAVRRLILDLRGVEFFGTAGFSALHNLNVRCAANGVDWALVPSKSVNRLLSICDPDGALPVQPSIDTALCAVHGEPRRLLKLVPQPR
jgi:anti-anti-sigma factor